MKPTVEYKIIDKRLGNEIPLPHYATEGAAGMDLRACIDQPQVLHPGQTVLIGTGIAIWLRDPGYVGIVVPRSGLGYKHGIVLGNLVGVIDSDYQGEIKVPLWNRTDKPYTIEVGERIAQYLVMPVVHPMLVEVADFSATSRRGEGGFGSTGAK
ncbi:MAG TPA: dUTP diphosphatase [Piscirickettsiaceae bacterium]|nr:dUTP diphosphatase [Piscirickettsiaceae bacterium]HIQ40896.1 dUTP diphosphatase [Sulfurivirga caldicuralii]